MSTVSTPDLLIIPFQVAAARGMAPGGGHLASPKMPQQMSNGSDAAVSPRAERSDR